MQNLFLKFEWTIAIRVNFFYLLDILFQIKSAGTMSKKIRIDLYFRRLSVVEDYLEQEKIYIWGPFLIIEN